MVYFLLLAADRGREVGTGREANALVRRHRDPLARLAPTDGPDLAFLDLAGLESAEPGEHDTVA